MRIVPLGLLTLGVAVAALFGARVGPEQMAYRVDVADEHVASAPLPPGPRLADWAAVGAPGWLAGVGLIVVGAVMARRQLAAEHAGIGSEGGSRVDFPGTLRRVEVELARIADTIRDLPFDDDAPAVRAAIDRLVDTELEPLTAGRGQLVARHGLAVFTSYFGPYASGERRLARCWSALTDGHPEVAREALAGARADLADALAAWERAETR